MYDLYAEIYLMFCMLNDLHYGQWIMMNVPFRKASSFLEDATDIKDKVAKKEPNM